MKYCASLILASAVLMIAATDSPGQIFGSKKAKVTPQQRVPELIVILRTDKDAHKRADAAEELRQFETKDFPEIVPVLIDALQSDPATNVRIEAVISLGRIRPVSAQAGLALEKAAANDGNMRVRLQANTSLAFYKISGYHTPKKGDTAGPVPQGKTDEPPLAGGGGNDNWWDKGGQPPSKSVPVTPGAPTNAYKPLPTGPTVTPPPIAVPSVPPPQAAPPSGPTLPIPPPVLQTPPPIQWVPVQPEGPTLSPPKL
jgi:hypothetical protein